MQSVSGPSAGGWIRSKKSIALGPLLVRCVRHAAVLEMSPESCALARLLPIPSSFRNEQMEQGIVACGNRAP